MLFKKRSPDARRVRQPAGRQAGVQQVFSYHARSSRTDTTGARSASKLPWANPSTPSPRQPLHKWPRRTIAITGAIFVAALLVNSLFLSRSTEIISLTGSDNRQVFLRSPQTYQLAASAILASSWLNTNKLTADTKKIATTMQEQFPELEQVSVTLPIIGRQPVIYILPARPALLLKDSTGGVYIVDSHGRALINASQVSKVEKLGLVIVEDQSGLPVKLGQTALPSNNVAFITEVLGQLKAKKVNVSGLVLPKATNELDVRVEGVPYMVKFNLRGDAREEAGAYLAVKQHLERENKMPAQYIDVRADNKAYYR